MPSRQACSPSLLATPAHNLEMACDWEEADDVDAPLVPGVRHRMVRTNGIDMHIAEAGAPGAPLVLLLHGFPEIWYSWRHQLPALAAAGFHAVAPDTRGCGLTRGGPDAPDHYTSLDIVSDLAGLLAALHCGPSSGGAFVVGHDWGARHAWDLALLRPDLVRALVALSVPFEPRLASGSVLAHYRAALGDSFYMARFQVPGLAEEDYARCGTAGALRRIFAYGRRPEAAAGAADLLADADLAVYVRSFERTGFTGALNPYRAMERSWQLKAAWTGRGVAAPALFMVGDRDAVYDFPGVREYVHGGGFARMVPNLERVMVLPDSDHFIQQQRHQLVSAEMVAFFRRHLAKHEVALAVVEAVPRSLQLDLAAVRSPRSPHHDHRRRVELEAAGRACSAA